MSDSRISALSLLLDQFAQANWDDRFTAARAELDVEGDRLLCTVGGETLEGAPGAPLLFASGAWALIFAHECQGRFGHRVDGRINRVWPNGVGRSPIEHGMDEAVREWAKLWPGTLFSSALYAGVETPGIAAFPRSRRNAPARTTLTGMLKRVAPSASDADPLERLKASEFLERCVRQEWSYTAEDAMMKAIGPALLALAKDSEAATREVALLALETCAERCWHNRAYGLYEPLCRHLIEAGLNAHLQNARLAESAYANGEIDEGDRLFAIATEGQNPLRALKLGSGFDHVGDWSDLHTRILRQAGGAQYGFSIGNDPNPARQAKREKKPVRPDTETAAHHRTLARRLLERAAEGAETRIATDSAAIATKQEVPLGSGTIDPKQRRLFLSEIFLLQAGLATLEEDEAGWLRAMFKAIDTEWRLAGSPSGWNMPGQEEVVAKAASRPDTELEALGMPRVLKLKLIQARKARKLSDAKK